MNDVYFLLCAILKPYIYERPLCVLWFILSKPDILFIFPFHTAKKLKSGVEKLDQVYTYYKIGTLNCIPKMLRIVAIILIKIIVRTFSNINRIN